MYFFSFLSAGRSLQQPKELTRWAISFGWARTAGDPKWTPCTSTKTSQREPSPFSPRERLWKVGVVSVCETLRKRLVPCSVFKVSVSLRVWHFYSLCSSFIWKENLFLKEDTTKKMNSLLPCASLLMGQVSRDSLKHALHIKKASISSLKKRSNICLSFYFVSIPIELIILPQKTAWPV